jgi:DNA-binding transcriptional MerR regulator
VSLSSSQRDIPTTVPPSHRLTIHEAAEATGWSARMLRYVESLGLVRPDRSVAGYRLYSAAQLDRLSSLRALVERFGIELGDASFALRLSRDPGLGSAIDAWLAGEPPAARLVVVPDPDWLGFEQDKQLRLLAFAGSSAGGTADRVTDRVTAAKPAFPVTPATTGPMAGRKEIA